MKIKKILKIPERYMVKFKFVALPKRCDCCKDLVLLEKMFFVYDRVVTCKGEIAGSSKYVFCNECIPSKEFYDFSFIKNNLSLCKRSASIESVSENIRLNKKYLKQYENLECISEQNDDII